MKGLQNTCRFPIDEFPPPQPQQYSTVPAGFFNLPWPDYCSPPNSTIIGRIGIGSSPASAFHVTEAYMAGLSDQYGDSSPPQTENHQSDHMIGQTSNGGTQYISPSEREHLLHIRNDLLGDLDDSNQDINAVSQNLYPASSHFDFSHTKLKQLNGGGISSSKTRIRWNQDLHDRFVESVNRLGGPDKATPKAILKLMETKGLTVLHVKSHLQKYRNVKFFPESVEEKFEKTSNSTNNSTQIDIETRIQLKEALQLQLDVQKRLHDQLEIQRNLQLRIDEQSEQLKRMFEEQQKGSRNLMEKSNKSDAKSTHNERLEDQNYTFNR